MSAVTEARPAAVLPRCHSFVGSREVEGRAGVRAAVNPATGQPFAEVSLLDDEQAGSALSAARAAFPAWARLSFRERGRFLLALHDALVAEADDVARLVTLEQGKPPAEAHAVEVIPAL